MALSTLLIFAGGIVVGFALAALMSIYFQARFQKIVKEFREELEKINSAIK